MKSPDYQDKIKKNLIAHYYEYPIIDPDIICEIEQLQKKLIEKWKEAGVMTHIYLHNTHPLLATGLLNDRNKLVEVSMSKMKNNQEKQFRELAYIEKIVPNADITGILDKDEGYGLDFSLGAYTMIEAIYYGKETVLRVSGQDVKDITHK